MNSDFRELLQALAAQKVEYLVVGGYAVIYHGEPRFTRDLDLWIRPSAGNANRLMMAFKAFGMPLLDIEEADFAKPGTQYVIGAPPVAIDFLTSVTALDFDQCWSRRIVDDIDEIKVNYLAREDLIASKKAVDRDQDRADVRKLEDEV